MDKLKDMNQQQLRDAIRDKASESLPQLASAIELAASLHAGQIRKDPVQGRERTPYIEHCLRNVLRLIRLDCTDAEVLIAAVLHDTVEDCARVFAPGAASELEARDALRAHIASEFGSTVLGYVDGLTNPYQPRAERQAMGAEQKNALYRAKVADAIRQSVGVYLAKFSDFVDNAGSLHHTPEHETPRAARLAAKYLPLVEVFRSVGAEYATSDSSVDWHEIDAILARIGQRLRALIAT